MSGWGGGGPVRGAVAAVALLLIPGCGGAPRTAPAPATPAPATPQVVVVLATPAPAPAPPPPTAPPDCAATALAGMDLHARAGQLLMVGLPSGSAMPAATVVAVHDVGAGGLVLFGTGWNGVARIRAAVDPLQALTAAGPAHLLVGGNQEGGERGALQAFYGPGFEVIPEPIAQGAMLPDRLQGDATRWGSQLAAAGVNLDLAPVADTVPPGTDSRNAPVGMLHREFGHDPGTVAAHAAAVVRGLRAGGVQATVKHFPGLGRVRGNTDFADSGIVDAVTGPDDAYLQPFSDGVRAGAGFVMVSSATYPRIDAGQPAVFSVAVMGVLRTHLGDDVVAISDDVGAARAVASVPVGERAIRIVSAGGDMVLTVVPAQAREMSAALVDRATADPAFRANLDRAALRVLRAKHAMGLLSGC